MVVSSHEVWLLILVFQLACSLRQEVYRFTVDGNDTPLFVVEGTACFFSTWVCLYVEFFSVEIYDNVLLKRESTYLTIALSNTHLHNFLRRSSAIILAYYHPSVNLISLRIFF